MSICKVACHDNIKYFNQRASHRLMLLGELSKWLRHSLPGKLDINNIDRLLDFAYAGLILGL